MTSTTPSSFRDTISRKKFLMATGAAGAAALLGAEPRARAAGTYPAYLNATQIWSADQTFNTSAMFGSGSPWIDVTAWGVAAGIPTGSTLAATATANVTALNTIFSDSALFTPSNSGAYNPTLYFPPGLYYINGAITTVKVPNTCNFCIMGAGYQSSQLVWSGALQPTAMLQLCSAATVTIKDIGFTIAASASVIPTYGIQIRNSLVCLPSGDGDPRLVEAPTDIRLKRVFVGGNSTQYMNTAIAYTADTADCDGNGDHGTFYDVDIQYAVTGYAFGTSQGLNHAIIGGSVQNCTWAAIDNTAIGPCLYGGSYHVYGTRFAGNGLTFRVTGDTNATSNTIDIVGISAGTAANPEGTLLYYNQPGSPGNSRQIAFIGGRAILNDPGTGSSVYYNAGNGQNNLSGGLEFHGFRMTSPTGVTLTFPGTARVTFMGGKIYTKSCYYAGALDYHGTVEMGTPTFTSSGLYTAHLVQIGCNNHLAGTSAVIASTSIINEGAAGTASKVGAVGVDLGGVLTVITDPQSTGVGPLVQIVCTAVFPVPPLVLLSPANAAAAQVMSTIFSGQLTSWNNGQSSLFISCSQKLATNTIYMWNYMILG